MSENSEPEAVDVETVAPLSNDRILYAMCFVVTFGTLIGFIFKTWQFGFGFLFGGVLSFINYYWLNASLKTLFAAAQEGGKSPFTAAKYFWRYIAIGTILLAVFLSKLVPVEAVILGLVSFVFAVMIEAFIRIFSGIFRQKEI
jgi:ATP synthase I chain